MLFSKEKQALQEQLSQLQYELSKIERNYQESEDANQLLIKNLFEEIKGLEKIVFYYKHPHTCLWCGKYVLSADTLHAHCENDIEKDKGRNLRKENVRLSYFPIGTIAFLNKKASNGSPCLECLNFIEKCLD